MPQNNEMHTFKIFFAFSFFENNTTTLSHPIDSLTFLIFTWMLVGLTKYSSTTNVSLNAPPKPWMFDQGIKLQHQ
jgi:hypothetical protein